MRKINIYQILVFLGLACFACALGIAVATWAVSKMRLGLYEAIANVGLSFFLVYAVAVIVYRGFLAFFPLKMGEIPADSKQEFIYHVYLLFYLIFFYPLMRSGAMPVPFMRVIYQALGAKLGKNTYSSGIILDPVFVEVGHNSIIGQYALLVPHVIEGSRLAHYPIRIGNNVTIGAGVIVFSGVSIGDNAIVSAGAVITKKTQIGDNEVWGGIPGRLLGVNQISESQNKSLRAGKKMVDQ